jgi:hypothetical protein
MKLKLVVAVLAIAALTVGAQAQSKGKKITKADAQKVVAMISADKAKAKTYCDIGDLSDQIEAAEKKKDTKKADALAQQMDALGQKLGPDYVALMEGMQDLDPNSMDGKDIGTVLEGLDKLCAK